VMMVSVMCCSFVICILPHDTAARHRYRRTLKESTCSGCGAVSGVY